MERQYPKCVIKAFDLKPECQNDLIRQYFLRSYELYELLFSCISNDQAYYKRPEPLRHPLIFYLGHTAVVYINKAIESGFLQQRINPKLYAVFAVGVNEMGWDDLTPEHYDWPTVQYTREYRGKVKAVMLEIIDAFDGVISWDNKSWGLLMGIEHEMIHLDTSAVIIRRLEIGDVRPVAYFAVCPARKLDSASVPTNMMLAAPSFKATFNTTTEGLKKFTWDNEIGEVSYDIKGFQASKYLVSNGYYLGFVEANGYQTEEYWTNEGWYWRSDKNAQMPLFWLKRYGYYYLRTLCEYIRMPWDWPAVVNHLEAQAFCQWKGKLIGKDIRLPTEAEYEALLSTLLPDGKANIRLEAYASETPVDSHMNSSVGFYDVIGNVWQHLSTIFYPYKGFKFHPYYEDFSSPTFDGKHNLMRGGSWINEGGFAEKYTRNFFRRHFHQFSGFRYVLSDNPAPDQLLGWVCDEALSCAVRLHYLQNDTYLVRMKDWILSYVGTWKGMGYRSCLTVGCSSGRLPFELTSIFSESVGLDSTSRFFRVATLLQDNDRYVLSSEESDNGTVVKAYTLGLPHYKRAQFFQQKPNNIDIKKFNSYDLIVVDNFSLGGDLLPSTLQNIHEYLKPQGYLVVNSAAPPNFKQQPDQRYLDDKMSSQFDCVASSPFDFQIRRNQCEVTVRSILTLWRRRAVASHTQ